jgi:hypothetical protein
MADYNVGNRLRKSIEEVREELLKRNIILLDETYTNNKSKIRVRCSDKWCEHEWSPILNNILSKGSKCPSHRTRKEINNELVDEFLSIYNIPFKRIETVINITHKHEWGCLRCDDKILTSFKEIRRYHKKKTGCVKCNGKNMRLSQEAYDLKLFNTHGGTIIRLEELNTVKTKILHKCLLCGKEWNAKPSSMISGSGACNECFKAKGEKWVGQILNELLSNLVNDQYKFKANGRNYFIDYELEINGKQYFIEYNGGQHYFPVKFFGGEQGFQKQIKRDKEVEEYCLINNIELIIIEYNRNRGKIKDLLYSMFAPIKNELDKELL